MILRHQECEEHYHGTTLVCDIATSQTLCNNESCGICGISHTGLDPQYIGKNIIYRRFGYGFYLAPNSSKCHDYTVGARSYRAMLLCAVLPGRKFLTQRDDVSLSGPPHGYDSIYGQAGVDLNFPEIVVSNPQAVLPQYIIVYQKDGIRRIAR